MIFARIRFDPELLPDSRPLPILLGQENLFRGIRSSIAFAAISAEE
jgi:hypothetical protein